VIDSAASLDIALRAGLHTGESEVTPEGLHGIAVHLAARVVAMAGPGEILVTSTVKDLVAGSGISFRDRGSATLKGIPGEQRIFAVDGSNGSAARI
jgi:class 3 adenylate cyclase